MIPALQEALEDVFTRILRGCDFEEVNLTAFQGSKFGPKDEIVAYLAELAGRVGAKILAGDNRLFGARKGLGVYFVYIPSPDPACTLRPEYQEGARCLYLAPTWPGLIDCGGPADKERVTQLFPDGLPEDYVLPASVL